MKNIRDSQHHLMTNVAYLNDLFLLLLFLVIARYLLFVALMFHKTKQFVLG